MRTIRESILSKKQGIYSKVSTEEDWKEKELFVSFLKSNGYSGSACHVSKELLDISKKCGCQVYSLGDYNSSSVTHWVMFCDYNKDKETVFLWRDEKTIDKLKSRGYGAKLYAVIKEDSSGSHWTAISDLEDFRDRVHHVLGL